MTNEYKRGGQVPVGAVPPPPVTREKPPEPPPPPKATPGGWMNYPVVALQQIGKLHKNAFGLCTTCQRPWPCETWKIVDAGLTGTVYVG